MQGECKNYIKELELRFLCSITVIRGKYPLIIFLGLTNEFFKDARFSLLNAYNYLKNVKCCKGSIQDTLATCP